MPGRFRLGVGSGAALNEHIFGARWPEANLRLEMLEEAVHVIRVLWEGGFKRHHGRHYTLAGARLYSLPDELPPILVSGFGPKAVELAARIGDGFVSVGPDSEGREHYRERGGAGPTTSGLKVCWGEDRDECVRTAHRLWPNDALGPGGRRRRLRRGLRRADRSRPRGLRRLLRPRGPAALRERPGRLALRPAQPSTPVAECGAPTGLDSGEPRWRR